LRNMIIENYLKSGHNLQNVFNDYNDVIHSD